MKVLNLYAGIGGNRLYWGDVDVTAVELNEDVAGVYKKLFPGDKVIIDDAHRYLLDNWTAFDFIWSSPPCQTHSRMNKFTRHKTVRYIDQNLYQEIILLKHWFEKHNYNKSGRWVVENVEPYYTPLIKPTVKIGRHYFWSNFHISNIKIPTLKNFTKATKQELMDYYDIYFEENIYLDGNHDPGQVFRNMVHPKLGKHILDRVKEIKNKLTSKQLEI